MRLIQHVPSRWRYGVFFVGRCFVEKGSEVEVFFFFGSWFFGGDFRDWSVCFFWGGIFWRKVRRSHGQVFWEQKMEGFRKGQVETSEWSGFERGNPTPKSPYPPCMEYLPLFTCGRLKCMVNVGIHGSYGLHFSRWNMLLDRWACVHPW